MRIKERIKKAFVILICLCMVLQYAPITAFAQNTQAQELVPENSVASVTVGDQVEYFTDLEKAFEAAISQNGSKLTLLKSVDMGSARLDAEGGVYTLDLNGCAISKTSGQYGTLWISEGADVTIIDSGEGGKITGTDYPLYISDSTIKIEGGTYQHVENSDVATYCAMDVYRSTVSITGGNFSGYTYGIRAENSDLDISGCTIFGESYAIGATGGSVNIFGNSVSLRSDSSGVALKSGCELSLSGGTIVAGTGAGVYVQDGSTATISGGSISSNYQAVLCSGNNSSVTITGGSISGTDYDLRIINGGNVKLALAEDKTEGVCFPDGIVITGKNLKEILDEKSAYWAANGMIDVADTQSSIVGRGDITIKVNCNHYAYDYTVNDDGTHSFTCSQCSTDVTEKHVSYDVTHKATCQKAAVCDLCGTSYGEVDPNAHTFDSETHRCACGEMETLTVIVDNIYGTADKVTLSNTTAVYGQDYVTQVSASVGSDVIAYGVGYQGNAEWMGNEWFEYDEETNTLTVFAQYVTNDLEIKAAPIICITTDLNGGAGNEAWEEYEGVEGTIFDYKFYSEEEIFLYGNYYFDESTGDYNDDIFIPDANLIFEKKDHRVIGYLDDAGNFYEMDHKFSLTEDISVTFVWKCDKEKLTYVEANAGTCSVPGYQAHYKCSCGKLYSDETGENETTMEELTTKLADHTPDNSIGQTCMGYRCTECESWYGETNFDYHAKVDENGLCLCGFTVYNIWVCDIRVTEVNKNNVLGWVDGGYPVIYDPETNTLHLQNAKLGDMDGDGIALKVQGDINLKLTYKSTAFDAIDVTGDLSITGGGSLTASGIKAGKIAFDDSVHVISTADCAVNAGTVIGDGYSRTAAGVGFAPFRAPGTEAYYEFVGKDLIEASFTMGSATTYYSTLNDAILAAQGCTAEDKAVVKLEKDIHLGNVTQKIYSSIFTLDLNGKTLSGGTESDGVLYVGRDASLAITDSSTGGAINGAHRGITVSRSILNITGGIILANDCAVFDYGYGTVNITGGSIAGVNYDIYTRFPDTFSGKLSIADGKTIGATFPGGITMGSEADPLTLVACLGEGMAYWKEDKMVNLYDDDTEITGGDVVIKAACLHQNGTKQNYIPDENYHTFTWSCCGLEVIESHTDVVFRDNGDGYSHNGHCIDCGQLLGHYLGWPHIYDPETHVCICEYVERFALSFYANEDDQNPVATFDVPYGTVLTRWSYDEETEEDIFFGAGEYLEKIISRIDTSGLVKEHHTFNGWNLENAPQYMYEESSIYALWAPVSYDITWDMSGCSYELYRTDKLPEKLAYNYGAWSHQLDFVRIEAPAGYEFAGFQDGDGNKLFLNDDMGSAYYTYRLTFTVSGDMTIKAIIEPKTYVATWTTGDGDGYEKAFKYGETITIPDNEFFLDTFRKTGHTLTGWEGFTEGMTMPLGGVTFTAIYEANTYTITFDTDGGTDVPSITQPYGTAITAPAAPTREGYHFVGWDSEIPATMPAGGHKLTAVWEEHKGFTYMASGNTISATCTAEGCTNTDGGSVTLNVDDAYYTGDEIRATVSGSFTDGTTYTLTYNDGSETAPSSIGTHTVKLTVYENGTAKQSVDAEYKISYLPAPNPAYAISGGYQYGTTYWFKTGATVTVNAPAGYTVSTTLNGTYGNDLSFSKSDNKVIYLKRTSDGAMTDAIAIKGICFDETAATGEITIEARGFWKKLLYKIPFSLFFKGDAVAKVEAMDVDSGVNSVQYYVANTDLINDAEITDAAAVSALETVIGSNWNSYNSEIVLNKNAKNIVYVKIIDNVGNVTYLSSEGIVLYSDAQAVTESVSTTYKTAKDTDVIVALNGNIVKSVANGTTVLNAGTDYTVSDNGKITLNSAYLDTLNTGTYTFMVSYNPLGMEYVEANGNDAPATTSFNVVIEKADGEVTNINISGKTYDETAVTAPTYEKLGDGAATVEYKKKGADDSTYTTIAPKNAGDYVVRVTIAEGTNHKAASATAEFSISRATLTNVYVQQNGKLAYDGGRALTPVVVANAMALNGEKVLFTYSADGTTYGSMPTFTESGTYTVHYCAYTTDNNFVDCYDTFIVTVGKAIVSEPTLASKPYNGSVQPADVPVSDLYTVEKNEGGIAKGSYDVVLKLKDSVNYKWNTTDNAEVTVTFVISAAENAWTATPAISSWTYGETANTPVGTAKYGTVKVVYSGRANDGSDYSSETSPTKAGNYTATFIVAGTEDYSGLSEQVNFTIAKATYDMTGAKWDYTNAIKYDGREHQVTAIGLPSGVTASGYTGNTAKAVGNYTAKVTLSYDSNNYNAPAVADLNWKIENNWTPTEYTVSNPNGNGWLNNEFVIKAADGYKVSLTNTSDGTWEDALTYSAETADGSVTFYLKNDTDSTISLAKDITYKIDKTPATGKVEFVNRTGWEDFINTISFGLFYKDEVTVKVTANDNLSGVAKIEYASADKAMTLEQVKAITDWTEYNGEFGVTLEDAKKFVYFVCITDKAGNVTYLSTDGAEYDTTAPVISDVENGKTYYTTQKVTVTDKNIDSITMNGVTAGNEITLGGNKEATYTIVATDKAGNTTTVSVTMKQISTLLESIKDITTNNVSADDAAAIAVVEEALQEVDTAGATAEEKEILKATLEKVDALQKVIEDTAEEVKALEDELAGYDKDTVTSDDQNEMNALVEKLKEKLKDTNLSQEQKADLEKALEDTKELASQIARDKETFEAAQDVVVNIDTDKVTADDADALAEAKEKLEAIVDSNNRNYTDAEKEAAQDVLDKIEELEKVIEDTEAEVKDIESVADALDADTVTSKDKESVEQFINKMEEKLSDANLTEAQKDRIEAAIDTAECIVEKIETDQKVLEDALAAEKDTTSDNYAVTDKADLEDAIKELEKIVAEGNANYTAEEKQKAQAEINRIQSVVEQIKEIEAAEDTICDIVDKVDAVQDVTIVPDSKELADAVINAYEIYNNLDDRQKLLLDQEFVDSLERVLAKVTVYKVIKGADGKYVKDSANGLSFTANGAFDFFKAVKINGSVLDAKHYTAKAGSTVVELTTNYLNSIDAGNHTFEVVYEVLGKEYIAATKFVVENAPEEADNIITNEDASNEGTASGETSPNTGDNTNVFGWMSAMFASMLALVVVLKKKKQMTTK